MHEREVGVLVIGIHARGMRGGLPDGEAEQRAALLGDVAEFAPLTRRLTTSRRESNITAGVRSEPSDSWRSAGGTMGFPGALQFAARAAGRKSPPVSNLVRMAVPGSVRDLSARGIRSVPRRLRRSSWRWSGYSKLSQ
jgi:hypothetical protein